MSCYVEKVISIAKNEIGYLEKASNDQLDDKTANAGKKNYTKYARDPDAISGFYNGKKQGHAYCDMFVDWCFVQAYGVENAKRLLCQPNNSAGAGCKESMEYYKAKGQLYTSPAIGDQIFFGGSFGSISHTGLVYDVDDTYVYTIEGNTSSKSGVVSNGEGAYAKKYQLKDSKIKGYGRPAYDIKVVSPSQPTVSVKPSAPSQVSKVNEKVLEWQKAAIADGFSFPKYHADGEWGNECIAVARRAIVKKRSSYMNRNLTKIVQRIVGVTADGLCGEKTDAAIREYQANNGLIVDGAVGLNTWKKMLGIA